MSAVNVAPYALGARLVFGRPSLSGTVYVADRDLKQALRNRSDLTGKLTAQNPIEVPGVVALATDVPVTPTPPPSARPLLRPMA